MSPNPLRASDTPGTTEGLDVKCLSARGVEAFTFKPNTPRKTLGEKGRVPIMANQDVIATGLVIAVVVAIAVAFGPQPQNNTTEVAAAAQPTGPERAELQAATTTTSTTSTSSPGSSIATRSPVLLAGEGLGVAWAETFTEVGGRYGLAPEYLAALASCETDFVPRESSAGAVGLMQVMPATAADLNRWYGTDLDPGVPAEAIELAALYTIHSIAELDVTDPETLARAYNAGNGAVTRDLPIAAETRRHMTCVPHRYETLGRAGS